MLKQELFPQESIEFDFNCGCYRFSNTTRNLEGVLTIRDQRFNNIPLTDKTFERLEFLGHLPKGGIQQLRRHKKSIQLIAIGSGLDETLDLAPILKFPSIIIDPLDPNVLKQGLLQLNKYNLSALDTLRVKTMLRRASVYNTSKIKHYKMTLAEAIEYHSDELFGKADVVMDFFGAWFYDQNNTRPNYELLLKPEGSKLIWVY